MLSTFKKDVFILLIVVLPFAVLPFWWTQFPDRVAIHFDVDGNPNGYAGKFAGLVVPALLNVGLYFFLVLLPRFDPSAKNYNLFEGPFRIMRLFTHLLLTFVCGVIYTYGLGYRFNMTTYILYGLPVFFMILGNYMGTVRPNHFVGIRTPWTLTNEVVWRRTHRLTARLWVAASIAVLGLLPFVNGRVTLLLVYTAVLAIIPMVYSYVVYRRLQQTPPEV